MLPYPISRHHREGTLGSKNLLEDIAECFYRGLYKTTISKAKSLSESKNDIDPFIMLCSKLTVAHANLEQHLLAAFQTDIDKIAEETQEQQHHSYDIYHLYTDLMKAQLFSIHRQFSSARTILLELYDNLQKSDHNRLNHSQKVKAENICLLYLSHTYLSLGLGLESKNIIDILEKKEPFDQLDLKFSFLLLKSRFALLFSGDYKLATSYAQKCYGEAFQAGWCHFTLRALLSLSEIYKAHNQRLELSLLLNLLRVSLEESEHAYIAFMMNDKFKEDIVVEKSIELDRVNRRILLGSQWIHLHESPKLFDFLEILHESEKFTSKKLISERLWPDEPYKPRVHDPRIFDIAKRVRMLIEPFSSQPSTLLSGRMGYKLATH